ncbi:MAG: hypothetical protein ACK5Z5_07205 [Neisseriaceae bacterium]
MNIAFTSNIKRMVRTIEKLSENDLANLKNYANHLHCFISQLRDIKCSDFDIILFLIGDASLKDCVINAGITDKNLRKDAVEILKSYVKHNVLREEPRVFGIIDYYIDKKLAKTLKPILKGGVEICGYKFEKGDKTTNKLNLLLKVLEFALDAQSLKEIKVDQIYEYSDINLSILHTNMASRNLEHEKGKSEVAKTSRSSYLIDDNDSGSFEEVDRGFLPEEEIQRQQEEAKKIDKQIKFGQLDLFHVDYIIKYGISYSMFCLIVEDDPNLDEQKSRIYIYHNKQLIIHDMIKKTEQLQKILNIYTQQNYGNSTETVILIPYVITERGSFREDHAVLIAIYQNEVYLFDPKKNPDDTKQVKTERRYGVGWQSMTNAKDCGRYTAKMAIMFYENFLHGEKNFREMYDFLKQSKIDLEKLQKEDYAILKDIYK